MTNKKINNLFISLVFLSILILIFNDNMNYGPFRALLRIPIKPFISIIDFTTETIGRSMTEEMLTQYLAEEMVDNQNLQFLKHENDMLREMLQMRTSLTYDLIPAEVIGGNPSDESEIVINKGIRSGLKVGMCAIFINGIVGKIVECANTYSVIETHSNMNFKVGVCDKDKKYFMIAYFYEKGLLKVENIQYDVVLKEGDTLYTSGFGNIYPANLRVGTIKKTMKSEDGEYFYLISPFEKIGSLKFVYITQKEMESVPSLFTEEKNESVGNFGWYRMLRSVK